MQYKSLRHHIADLSKTFGRMNDWDGYEDVSEWLRLASAIKLVEFDDIEFDDLLGYCGLADDYEFARDSLLQEYVTSLSRFTYVWNALECFVDHIYSENAPPRKKYGKIGSACHLISSSFDSQYTPVGYDNELDSLKRIGERPKYKNILDRFASLPNHVNYQSSGLYSVYLIRNMFAHGALEFPAPDLDADEPNFVIRIPEIATRITLFSLAMLLAAKDGNFRYTVYANWLGYEAFDDEEPEVDLLLLLKVFHLADLHFADWQWTPVKSE